MKRQELVIVAVVLLCAALIVVDMGNNLAHEYGAANPMHGQAARQ